VVLGVVLHAGDAPRAGHSPVKLAPGYREILQLEVILSKPLQDVLAVPLGPNPVLLCFQLVHEEIPVLRQPEKVT